MDKPDCRKTHVGAIPAIGGLALLLTTILIAAIWPTSPTASSISPVDRTLLAVAVIGLAALCTADTLRPISPLTRLVCEIFIACAVVLALDLAISNLGDLLGTGNIKIDGVFASILTTIAIVGLLNACNMLDGMDGLLPLLVLASLAPIYLLTNNATKNFILILITYLTVFLLFNLQVSQRIPKCFLGDAGSKLIGLFLGSIILVASSSSLDEKAFRPATGLFFLSIFIFDFASTLVRRAYTSKPLMQPDRAHIHHLLQDLGVSRNQILLYLAGFQAFMSTFGYLLDGLAVADKYQFGWFMFAFAIYVIVLKKMWTVTMSTANSR